MSRPNHIRGGITPEVVADVRRIVEESVRHSYSVSRIFEAHNLIFNRLDKPQTCSTCLRNRVRDLKRWLAEYDAASATPEAAPEAAEAEAKPKRRARKTGRKEAPEAAPEAAAAVAPKAVPEEAEVPDPVDAAGGIADYSSLLR
ncbi:hypothetical protein [uncultured Alistipes sp.]|uniref:hypothetical protein n=2 Tax=uncultured Alistipes sp. TaxID=538949 RepID=UPI002658987D|nr:hypothetical protein [uncultured Alistipes sp.]